MKRLTHDDLENVVAPSQLPHEVAQITFGELLFLYMRARPGKSSRSRPYRLKKWLSLFGDLHAWEVEALLVVVPEPRSQCLPGLVERDKVVEPCSFTDRISRSTMPFCRGVWGRDHRNGYAIRSTDSSPRCRRVKPLKQFSKNNLE